MSKRALRLRDAFSRLEITSNHGHLRDASGVIQNVVGSYSGKLWPDGGKECEKWDSICNELIDLVNGANHQEEDRKFEDVLRDLIHVFQHGEERIAQLLDSNSIKIPEEEITQRDKDIFAWMDRAFSGTCLWLSQFTIARQARVYVGKNNHVFGWNAVERDRGAIRPCQNHHDDTVKNICKERSPKAAPEGQGLFKKQQMTIIQEQNISAVLLRPLNHLSFI